MTRYGTSLVVALVLGLWTGVRADEPTGTADKDKPGAEKKGLPLKPDRTIELNLEAGTWVTLDVSPDGKTIAFMSDESGNDEVYVRPELGGAATKLTPDLVFAHGLDRRHSCVPPYPVFRVMLSDGDRIRS